MPDRLKPVPPNSVADLSFPPREGGYVKGHETREQILYAALGLLIDEGYRAMSMRRIAAACGMKLGNLTYHFPTREDLVQALLEAVISSYEVEFIGLLTNPALQPETRFASYCQLILEDIRTKKTTRVFLELWALSNHDAFVSERVHELYYRARAPLLALVTEMRPDLTPDQHEIIALFISGSMEGLTVFAGYNKPFEIQMPMLESMAVYSFLNLVQNFRPGEG